MYIAVDSIITLVGYVEIETVTGVWTWHLHLAIRAIQPSE